jgi:hypothetical protein
MPPDHQAERQQPGALEPIHEQAERDRGGGPDDAERERLLRGEEDGRITRSLTHRLTLDRS